MEARGEIPENLPAGRIRVIVVTIISPPNGKPNWEGVSSEERAGGRIGVAPALGLEGRG
jgi:hypothetical protein